MSTDYVTATVKRKIPGEFLASAEKWLLTRVFETEATDNWLGFHACWTLEDLYFGELPPDEELNEVLATSRHISPDLCSSIEREIEQNSVIMLGAVDYEKIFQSIVRRHSDFLRHISIEEHDCNTKSFDGDETFTLITADAIESIRTKRVYEQGDFEKVEIVRRSGPRQPTKPAALPYILFSKRDVAT